MEVVNSCPLGPGLAHGEAGQIEATTDFPYDAIDQNMAPPLESVREAGANDRGLKMFIRLVEWLWQDGKRNPEGLLIRAGIVCWIFLPHLHPLTLTQMAGLFCKHKQSWGRWVDDWKLTFPKIRNPHMK